MTVTEKFWGKKLGMQRKWNRLFCLWSARLLTAQSLMQSQHHIKGENIKCAEWEPTNTE